MKVVKFFIKLDTPYNNGSLEILLVDRSVSTDREIATNSLYTAGPRIEMRPVKVDPLLGKGWSTYIAQIHENIFVENDPTKKCKNYPNEDHETYNDCDKAFIRESLTAKFGPDFVPIWATSSSNVSDVMWDNATGWDLHAALVPLFDGGQVSDCPLPCKTTSVTTRLLTERFEKEIIIEIVFGDTVTTTSTDFVKFNPFFFISEVGGAMGLWLGLGIIQFLEVVVKFGSMAIAKVQTKARVQEMAAETVELTIV